MFGLWAGTGSLSDIVGEVLVGVAGTHVQFVGHIVLLRRLLRFQALTLSRLAISPYVLIEEDCLRGVLMGIDSSLIADPVQIGGYLCEGRWIATIAAVDAAKGGYAHENPLLRVLSLEHQGSTRVAIASGSGIATTGADVRSTIGQWKVGLASPSIDDLQLDVAQDIADRMNPSGIASPAGGDGQLVLEAAVLVVPLRQLDGMDALWKHYNSLNNNMLLLKFLPQFPLTIKADGMWQPDQGDVILQSLGIPGGIDVEVAAGHHQSHLALLLGILDLVGPEEDQSPLSPARDT